MHRKLSANGADSRIVMTPAIACVKADGFEAARAALMRLDDMPMFLRLRRKHPNWPDCEIHKQMFLKKFRAAKDEHNAGPASWLRRLFRAKGD